MIPFPSGTRVWLATGHTDMRRGMNSLALQVQEVLKRDPYDGQVFVFRGKRGERDIMHPSDQRGRAQAFAKGFVGRRSGFPGAYRGGGEPADGCAGDEMPAGGRPVGVIVLGVDRHRRRRRGRTFAREGGGRSRWEGAGGSSR